MIKQMSIKGFRGFGQAQTVDFSIPNGNYGSGINIIVGANNSGKSTIIESIKAFNGDCSFSEGKRNVKTAQRIELKMIDENNCQHVIRTIQSGGSQVEYENRADLHAYILPSRRYVDYEFTRSKWSRDTFTSNQTLNNRTYGINQFYTRLFSMIDHKNEIDGILRKILGASVDWTIEQQDNGKYYVKFTFAGVSHSSEGVGDGLWSILTICDAIYDSQENGVVVIDEPELSLHPAYQKRVLNILLEYAKTRQIIISTHSPYFINWQSIVNGGALIRCQKLPNGNIQIGCLQENTKQKLNGLIRNLNNPHILGLDANEVFFLEDNVIVTEGQEDVIFYNKAMVDNNTAIIGNFYGWGAGGANNEQTILSLLQDLGYKKVVAVFDGDKAALAEEVRRQFPAYKCIVLPRNDIRDKNIAAKNVEGIMTHDGQVKTDYVEWFVSGFVEQINTYFQS